MYSISLENFSGPLEKLLELIEQKKMDITSISLAEVTGDFIAYAQELKKAYDPASQEVRHAGEKNRELARLLADFLVVASQLILIKSRTLLPKLELAQDEEEGGFGLEEQLRIYSDMKPVFLALKKKWPDSLRLFSRDYFRAVQPVFYPPAGLTAEHLSQALAQATSTLGTLLREEEKVERQLVTLEEKIKELSGSVLEGVQRFSSLISERTKHEAIVMFLALLHLLRDRTVQVRQEGLFGEIEFSQGAAANGGDADAGIA